MSRYYVINGLSEFSPKLWFDTKKSAHEYQRFIYDHTAVWLTLFKAKQDIIQTETTLS